MLIGKTISTTGYDVLEFLQYLSLEQISVAWIKEVVKNGGWLLLRLFPKVFMLFQAVKLKVLP